jgi:hypothetical protein
VLREAAVTPNMKRYTAVAWGVGVSHEMMNSRERRLFSWSNATCAMPLCEALSIVNAIAFAFTSLLVLAGICLTMMMSHP